MVGGDAAVVACVKCEKPWVLPPFPTWEGVLATETGDLAIIDGWDNTEEILEGVARSMTEWDEADVSHKSGLIPRFFKFCFNSSRMA